MKTISNKKIRSEKDLTHLLKDFFTSRNYEVRLEIPNMGQSADLVAIDDNSITFLEAKINDWKRALEQCVTHEAVADYIFIAVATVKVSADLISEIEKRGYGLIHCEPYSSSCEIVVNPRQNLRIWKPQRQLLLTNMELLSSVN